MKIVVIRPSAGSRDYAYDIRCVETEYRFRSGRAYDGRLSPRQRRPGDGTPMERYGSRCSRGSRAVAKFRWAKRQKHYSGTYWSATEHGHVIYESRLELARLLHADFDTSVNRIVAQPFLLNAKDGGQARRHIPDFLLITDTGAVVVDVKPQHRLADPKVSSTFAWTKTVVEARGWRYEVATEPPVIELGNVRFLAGYRRSHLFDEALVIQVRASDVGGATFAEAVMTAQGPRPLIRAALLHLLWRQEFVVDMTKTLTTRTVLRRSAKGWHR